MCYQNCIKYECPNCGKEPISDRRTYALCLRSSGCQLLHSRPETLPRRVFFEPGPLCNSCRQLQERQRQRQSARNATQNTPSPRYANHPRRRSYGQFPAREVRSAGPTYPDFGRHANTLPTQPPHQRRSEWADDPYSLRPRDDGIDYENYYRDHATQPNGYTAHPPPRPYRASLNRRPSPPMPRHEYQTLYRAPHNLPEATPAPSYQDLDRGPFDDVTPGAFFGNDDLDEYRDDYWIHDVRSLRFE